MDEHKDKVNRANKGRVIDLGPALEEKERAERLEAKRLRKEERPPLGRRVLSLVLVLAIVLAAVGLTVYWDRLNFDALRRSFSYFGTQQSEEGQTEAFTYDRGTGSSFAALGKYLAFASNKEAVLYDYSGKAVFDQEIHMDAPALDIGGSAAVVYDVGGRDLLVFGEKGEKLSLELDEGLSLYDASLNRSDWLAVTAQKKSQKGCVTVYNADMEKVFEFDSSSRYVMNAYVTEDCRYMVAQTLEQDNGTFVSQMVVYQLDSEEQYASFPVEGALVLEIGSVGGQTLCIAEDRAVLATAEGKISATYNYEMPYLRDFSCEGDGFAVLAMNRHRAGTSGKLVTLNTYGEALGELDLSEEILNLSAAGRYVAVLYADRLVVYNKDLTEYVSFDRTEAAESVCMRSDGSVWLMTSDEISLLLP